MMTVKLLRPIKAHGADISELSLREPLAGDLRSFKLGDNTVGNWIPLIAGLANIPPSSVESMTPGDLFSAIGAISPLLLSPETGETS